jgi:hypothetical protein
VDTFRAIALAALSAPSWAASPSDRAIAALLPPNVQFLARAPVGVDLDFVAVLASSRAPIRAWDSAAKLGLFLQGRSNTSEVHRLAILDGHADGECEAPSAVFVSTGEFILSCAAADGTKAAFHERFLYDVTSKTLRGSVRGPRQAITRLELQHDHIAFRLANGESYSFLAGAPATLFRAQVAESPRAVRFGPRNAFTLERSARKGVWSITERSGPKPRFHPFPPEDYWNAPEAIGPWQVFGNDLFFATEFAPASGAKGAHGFFNTAARRYEMQAPAELASRSATAVFADATHIYIGYRDRLAVINRESKKLELIPVPSPIGAILAHRGRVYLGTAAGLTILSESAALHYFIHPDGPQLQEYLSLQASR